MAFMSVKLIPGVHAEQTPLLLQAGVIQSNNIRWRDGLPEKMGGWQKFYFGATPANPAIKLQAQAAFTTDYSAIYMPPNPGLVRRGMTVVDQDTGLTLGTVDTYGPSRREDQARLGFEVGDLTIEMYHEGWRSALPGMQVLDDNNLVGTVASWINQTLTLTAGALIDGESDTLTFSSGTQNVLFIIPPGSALGPLQSASAGANDTLVFGPPGSGGTPAITPPPLAGPIRELWTWEDLNIIDHLAAAGDGGAFVLTGGVQQAVTPQYAIRTPTVMATSAGSSQVVVNDVGSFSSIYESITLQTPYSVGGIVIYPGSYPVVFLTPGNHDSYTIDIGKPALTTAASGTICTITSAAGSASFTVSLDNHGLSVGSNFSIVLPTSIGGTVLQGFFSVATVLDANTFTILASTAATSVDTQDYGNVAIQVTQWIVSTPATAPVISALAAFAAGYSGIIMPPNPGWVTPGITVTDQSAAGAILGTVQSYGPVSVNQVAGAPFLALAPTVDMTPNTNAPGIVPGMTVYDASAGGPATAPLGTVSSYVGNTLGLNPPGAAFDAYYTIGCQSAYTTNEAGIYVPPRPPWVTGGMIVTDLTTGVVLGQVFNYGPSTRDQTVRDLAIIGSTSITMFQDATYYALPGMTIIDQTQGGAFVGTVAGWSFNVVHLTSGTSFPIFNNDVLTFSSGAQSVLWIGTLAGGNAPFPANAAGVDDILYFGLNDTLTFSSGTTDILVLNAPLPISSSGANDVLGFAGAPNPPPVGIPVTALDWCMFNFGSPLIINPEDGPLFSYDPTTGLSNAQLIPNAPSKVHGIFLAMPEQMIVAYGASTQGVQDPMLVAWCDAGDFNTWTLAVTNQAGTFRLSRGSKIVGGMQMPMQAMLWTDIGFWLMTYIGYPDVWGFSEVAQECGLIAKKAAGVLGSQVFWMGKDKFWTFTGGQVQPLPCEVWDAVFQNLNHNLLSRIRCSTDTAFDTVYWFFPSLATAQPGALQENDSFVKFNRVSGEWDYGTPVDVYGDGATGGLLVSDWIDANVYGNPISAMTDSTGKLSQLMWMNMGRDADEAPLHWWFRTGLFLLSEGEDFIYVDRCRPDFRWRSFTDPPDASAQIQFTLYAQDDSDNPTKPPKVYGPFTVNSSSGPFDPRARGRYFSIKVEGDDLGSFVRLGAVKFRFSPDGRSG